MAFSFLPKEDQYFELFSQMTEKIKEGALILSDMLEGPYENFEASSKRIKTVEHECDQITHSVTTKLNKSFITPFDREDIYTLAVSLDDVCDYIDAGARAVVMYDIREVDEYIKETANIIKKLAEEINLAVGMLKQAKGMKQHLLNIQTLEN
jgi:predicted phosphate transport protein (TIGR00153 family)